MGFRCTYKKVKFPNGNERTMVRTPLFFTDTDLPEYEKRRILGEDTESVLARLGYSKGADSGDDRGWRGNWLQRESDKRQGKYMYTLGIDIGSTTSKCVILEDGRTIVAKSLVKAGTGTSGPDGAYNEVLHSSQAFTQDEIAFTMATGYGRKTYPAADAEMR